MNIFRWISDATSPRDRRRREEARCRHHYQTNPLSRYSPRSWAETHQNWPEHNRVTIEEDNPRIVFVSPGPNTISTNSHHRHHHRRRHQRVKSVATDIPVYSSYMPSCSTDPGDYLPWYPAVEYPANTTDYATGRGTNITLEDSFSIQTTAEASYVQAERDRDRQLTREINRLTQDPRADDSDDQRRWPVSETRRRRHNLVLETEHLGNGTSLEERHPHNERAIRHRIAELEADIHARELRRYRRRSRDSERGEIYPELYNPTNNGSDLGSRRNDSRPVSNAREPSSSYSYSGGYLRPRVRFSPAACCYGNFTPGEGHDSSGSEEVYYGDRRYYG